MFIDCLLSIHWIDAIEHLLCAKCHGYSNEHRRWTAWPHGTHIPMTVLLLLSHQISWPGLTWTHRPIRWGVITYLTPPPTATQGRMGLVGSDNKLRGYSRKENIITAQTASGDPKDSLSSFLRIWQDLKEQRGEEGASIPGRWSKWEKQHEHE